MTATIVVCPGQGAQRPRMLTPWIQDPVASAQLREWSLRAGVDLTALGTEASMAEISRTENAQPLLVAQALLITAEVTDRSIAVAGHSVGELAAAAMAGVLEPGDAVRLARLRGLVMAEACRAAETTMAAILGGRPRDRHRCHRGGWCVRGQLQWCGAGGCGRIVESHRTPGECASGGLCSEALGGGGCLPHPLYAARSRGFCPGGR